MFNPNQYKVLLGVFAIVDIYLAIHSLRLLKENERLQLQHIDVVRYLANTLDEHNINLDEFDVIALQNLGIVFKEN